MFDWRCRIEGEEWKEWSVELRSPLYVSLRRCGAVESSSWGVRHEGKEGEGEKQGRKEGRKARKKEKKIVHDFDRRVEQ